MREWPDQVLLSHKLCSSVLMGNHFSKYNLCLSATPYQGWTHLNGQDTLQKCETVLPVRLLPHCGDESRPSPMEIVELKRGLKLPDLQIILEDHYEVDSSSDLLHRLMNISQDPKKSAQNFLFRAIKRKEKLMRKSSDDSKGVWFS